MNPGSVTPSTAIQRLIGGDPSSQTGGNGTGPQTGQRDLGKEAMGGGGGHTHTRPPRHPPAQGATKP